MTVDTYPWIRQTLAYTVMAKDDLRYSPGLRQTLAYTVRAKDDGRCFARAEADPSFHCWVILSPTSVS